MFHIELRHCGERAIDGVAVDMSGQPLTYTLGEGLAVLRKWHANNRQRARLVWVGPRLSR